jgi:hypothetical protein
MRLAIVMAFKFHSRLRLRRNFRIFTDSYCFFSSTHQRSSCRALPRNIKILSPSPWVKNQSQNWPALEKSLERDWREKGLTRYVNNNFTSNIMSFKITSEHISPHNSLMIYMYDVHILISLNLHVEN